MEKEKNMNPVVKRTLLAIGALLFLAFAILACLPTFFSSNYGKTKLINWYNNKTSQNLEIDRLSLNWFSSQEIEKVKITDRQGQEIFACPRIEIESSLWTILWVQDMGKVNIETPKTNLNKIPETSSTEKKTKKEKVFVLPLKGNILITNGTLSIPSQEIYFTNTDVNILIPKGYSPITITITSQTNQQGLTGNFTINAALKDVFSSKKSIDVDAVATNLPVKGIDALFSVIKPKSKGFLSEALGASLNLQLKGNFAKDRLLMDLQLDSPNLHTVFTTQAKDNEVFLAAPAELNFTASPAFFNKLSLFYPFLKRYSLQKPTKVQVLVSSFSFPMDSSNDLRKLSLNAHVNMGQTNLIVNEIQKSFSIDETSFDVSSEEIQNKLQISSTLAVSYQKTTGQVRFSSTIENVFDKAQGTISLQAENIPTDLIDPSLSSLIGNTLAVKTDGKVENGIANIQFSLQTPLLTVPSAKLRLDDQRLSSIAPFPVRYQITKEAFSFAENSPLMVTEISSLEIPFKTLDKTRISCKLSIEELAFSPSLPLEKSPVTAVFDINTLSNITLSAQTKQLSFSTQGALLLKEKIFKTNKTLWTLTLQPNEFAALTHLTDGLQAPVIVRGEVSSFTIPLDGKEFSLSDFTAKSTIDTLTLHDIALTKINIGVGYVSKSSKLSFQLDSQAKTGQEIGSLSWNGDISPFNFKNPSDFKNAQINTNLNCKNFSVAFLSNLIKEPTLENAIGKTLNAQITMVSAGSDQNFDMLIKSSNLQIEGSLKKTDNKISIQKKPLCFTATLNTDGYNLLHKWFEPNVASVFVLQGQSLINLCLSDLTCSYSLVTKAAPNSKDQAYQINWSSLNYKAKLDIDTLSFLSKQGESVFVKNTQLLSNKSTQDDRFYFQMQGTTGAKSQKSSQEGGFTINGNLFSLEKGTWSPDTLKTNFQVSFKQFPTILLDILTSNQESCFFTSLFGNTISLAGETTLEKLTGPISFNLNSPNVRVAFSGDVKSGMLSLKEPLIAQVQLTQNLSQCFLKDTKISSIYSNNPITVSIDAKNFAYPLYPFDASKVNAPNVKVELGQIFCENRGNASTLLKILKSSSSGKTVKLWFAPLDMHVRNGIAAIERTEILINDTFQIATWGQIDFPKDYVDMVIGLTAQSLQAAFGITKLPENYVMQIPVKGPLGDVEINTSMATTKVAALLAWQHGEALAGKGGGIFGGFLGALATLPDRDSDVPPPKRPFPWEGQVTTPQKKQKSHKRKTKAIYKEDDPFKQLWKVIR